MATPPVGSKSNPSQFDVLGKLGEDEPYFVIRAHDPLSSALVELHASGWANRDIKGQNTMLYGLERVVVERTG